jgi:hypothetical protein
MNAIGNGTLLAVLLVSGNYLGELLPCEVRQKLQQREAKYIILLFSIWYFISGGGMNASVSTVATLFCAFGLVILLTKTHWRCFMAVITLLFIGDVLKKCQLETVSTVFNVLAVVLLLLGFAWYLRHERSEKAPRFTWKKFWLENSCDKLSI